MNIIQGSDISVVEEPTVLARFIRAVAKMTATEMLVATGGLKNYMSKSEAYRRWGRRDVDQWIEDGYVEIVNDAPGDLGKKRINRAQIESVAEAQDLVAHQIMKDNESKRQESAVIAAQGTT